MTAGTDEASSRRRAEKLSHIHRRDSVRHWHTRMAQIVDVKAAAANDNFWRVATSTLLSKSARYIKKILRFRVAILVDALLCFSILGAGFGARGYLSMPAGKYGSASTFTFALRRANLGSSPYPSFLFLEGLAPSSPSFTDCSSADK